MSDRQKRLEAKALRLEHFKEVVKRLIVVSGELNKARDEFRSAVSRIMGCNTDGWTITELEEYVEGLIKQTKENGKWIS